MQRLCAGGLFLLLLLLTPSPGASEPGRHVAADVDTSRIVSIGGTVTEILYALGVEDRIVAVDLTSTFPSRARSKPQVGYMRALSPEGVLSLAPTLIIAIEDAGPKEALAVLENASVPLLLVPKARDSAGVAETIRMVAEAVGARAEGHALADAVLADLAAIEAMLADVSVRRKAVFVLGMSGGSPMIGGRGTAAADMFALAHVDNALSAMQGYRSVSDEAVVAAAPEAVVLMAERSHDLSDASVLAAPAFAGTPAARARRLIRMSGTYLLNLGPRTAHAVRDLAAALYPELDITPLPKRPWTIDPTAEE